MGTSVDGNKTASILKLIESANSECGELKELLEQLNTRLAASTLSKASREVVNEKTEEIIAAVKKPEDSILRKTGTAALAALASLTAGVTDIDKIIEAIGKILETAGKIGIR